MKTEDLDARWGPFQEFYQSAVIAFLDDVAGQCSGWRPSPEADSVLRSNLSLIHENNFDYGIALAITLFSTGLNQSYLRNGPENLLDQQSLAAKCLACYAQCLPLFTNLLIRLLQQRYDVFKPEFIAPPSVVRPAAYKEICDLLARALECAVPKEWMLVRGDPWSGMDDECDHCWLPLLLHRSSLAGLSVTSPILGQIKTHIHPLASEVYSGYNLLRQSYRRAGKFHQSKDLEDIHSDPTKTIPSTAIALLRAVTDHLSQLLDHSLSTKIKHGSVIALLEYRDIRVEVGRLLSLLAPGFHSSPMLVGIMKRKLKLEDLLIQCVRMSSSVELSPRLGLEVTPPPSITLYGQVLAADAADVLSRHLWLPAIEINGNSLDD